MDTSRTQVPNSHSVSASPVSGIVSDVVSGAVFPGRQPARPAVRPLQVRPADPFAQLSATALPPRRPREPDAPGICTAADVDGRPPYAADESGLAHSRLDLTERTPLLPSLPRSSRIATGTLVLRSSDGQTRRLPADRPLSVGSGPDNDWVLRDSFVSQRHAVLSSDGAVVRVRDRGSMNGTFINGARIQQGELHVGGCLVIGRTRIRLEASAEDSPLRGDSPGMQRVRAQIARFAGSELPVLVLGESGTGKELVARALHEQSGRRGPLIAVNCGALPRELIESELFGHERGAFTGAQKRHLGCFGEADGGTLFLDEIGELPLELQPRLLRALESKTVRPIGATREVPVDVRIVAATHRDVEHAVTRGAFRQDLYYRLCGLELSIPPLRERPEDIRSLVRHFLAEPGAGLPPLTISDAELAEVARHPWPGNVRQLRNAVLRALHLHSGGGELTAAELLGELRGGRGAAPPALAPAAPGGGDELLPILGRRFVEIERDVYLHALAQTGGNCRAAAELLDVPKSTLHDKLRRLGIGVKGKG